MILEELNEIEDELSGKTTMTPIEPDELAGETAMRGEPYEQDELAGETTMAADEPDMEKHLKRSKALSKVTQILQKLLSELT